MGSHQSLLAPAANKFHAGNGEDGKHYWLTPPDLYTKLDAEFNFNFDPSPYPLPVGFDGLTCEWGTSNYVNPPNPRAEIVIETMEAQQSNLTFGVIAVADIPLSNSQRYRLQGGPKARME